MSVQYGNGCSLVQQFGSHWVGGWRHIHSAAEKSRLFPKSNHMGLALYAALALVLLDGSHHSRDGDAFVKNESRATLLIGFWG
jgi:hypothetical protein